MAQSPTAKPQIPNVKVVLLGRQFSGKTSLVNRYIYDKFTVQGNVCSSFLAPLLASAVAVDIEEALDRQWAWRLHTRR